MSFDIICHRAACGVWIGESRAPMEFVGVFKVAKEREHIPAPRDAWRCKGCGWTNVFKPVPADAVSSWRSVELKRGA